MVQNDKKFCPSLLIYQERYIICLPFILHMWKVIISPGCFFHFFKILLFRVVRVVKVQKWSKMTKSSVCCAPYLRNHTSYGCHLCYTCVKWYLQTVFHTFKILIFQILRGLKGGKKEKKRKSQKIFVCCTPYLRNHTSYDCHLWYTFVKW